MEEVKNLLVLVLGSAVQVGLGQGWRGPAFSHLVFGFVGTKLPLSEVGVKLPSAQHGTFLASSEKGPLNRWQSMLVPGHLWQQAGGGSSAQGAISKLSPV